MTAKEIDELILAGKPLVKLFFPRNTFHELNARRITEKQFMRAKIKFSDRLDLLTDHGGVTRHIYTIKK